MYNHQCNMCNTAFSGRKNKIFCSKECKTQFNNEKSRKRNSYLNATVSEIKRNRTIIKKMHELFGSKPLPISILKETELNFGCITGYDEHGQTLFGDYKIERMPNNTFYINKLSSQ